MKLANLNGRATLVAGAGGIDVKDILIADDVVSFADAVVQLLRDPNAAARIGAAA